MPLRPRKILQPRYLPLYILAGVAAAAATPSAAGVWVAAPAVAAGVALRAWGAGHLVKTDRLTVSGPYARLRHPLYAGTLLVGGGFAWLLASGAGVAGLAAVVLLFPAWFFGLYFPRKERLESARLERRFGEPYRRYRAEVPALLPRPRAWRPADDVAGSVDVGGRWARERWLANNEHATAVGVLCGAAAVALVAARSAVA